MQRSAVTDANPGPLLEPQGRGSRGQYACATASSETAVG